MASDGGPSAALRFEHSWEDPLGARGDELRATWARLRIAVDGRPVTAVADRGTLGVRDAIYGPLLPLAEWLAENWWFLLYEPRAPHKGADFGRRHDLSAAGEGFLLPHLEIVPDGEAITLAWAASGTADDAVRFIPAPGRAAVDPGAFRRVIGGFVQSVRDRLADRAVDATFLAEEWAEVERIEADGGELSSCRDAARLGEHPFAMSSDVLARLTAVRNLVSGATLSDLLEVTGSDRVLNDAHDLRAILGDRCLTTERGGESRSTVTRPWQRGYDAARRLRAQLGIGARTLRTLDALVHALAPAFPELSRRIEPRPPLRNHLIDGAVIANGGAPAFLVFKEREEQVRFALCRGAHRALELPSQPGLLTAAETAVQASGRAFAAELLAPAALLGEALGTRGAEPVTEDTLGDLADRFGVSPFVIQHQLENHRIARVQPLAPAPTP